MENMTTQDKNILIGEFMGFKLQDNSNERWFNNWFTNPNQIWSNRIQKLHFDTDWNWLMQVVRKIEQLEDIYECEDFLLIRDELCTGRIETSFSSVVEFIQWYNQQKN
jgi:hypothetical protein